MVSLKGIENPQYKHGLRMKIHPDHSLYNNWKCIKQRCLNPNNPAYKNYGGRGIKIYNEWLHDPVSFIEYIKSLPDYGIENYTLDRINNDSNYEPDNLRWVCRKIQRINQRLQNNNKTGYKGVFFCNYHNKYISKIGNKRLKDCDTIEEALKIRNQYIIDNNLPYPIQNFDRD